MRGVETGVLLPNGKKEDAYIGANTAFRRKIYQSFVSFTRLSI